MRASLLLSVIAGARSAGEFVNLYNAAAPGQTMPAVGLGNGGYGEVHNQYNAYPECWMDIFGCGPYTQEAVKDWLRIGGRRLDSANSYYTQVSVGLAMKASGVPRGDIFLLQKTGNPNAMGFNDSLSQMDAILSEMGTPYVDLLLNHWPTSPGKSTDPVCQTGKPAYDEKACRLSTWRAYVQIWEKGQARAIGVANYNATHLQEIIDAGLPLPAVNQVPFHLYNAAAQEPLRAWCAAHNVTLLSYSPMGIPDWHAFPTGPGKLPASTTLADPVLLSITAAHAPATPGQVILAWLWAQGLPSNPRSMNATHMADNLNAFTAVTLSAAEVAQLSSRPVDYCSIDGSFYECVPDAQQALAAPPRPASASAAHPRAM